MSGTLIIFPPFPAYSTVRPAPRLALLKRDSFPLPSFVAILGNEGFRDSSVRVRTRQLVCGERERKRGGVGRQYVG